jgi:hypothetical protein
MHPRRLKHSSRHGGDFARVAAELHSLVADRGRRVAVENGAMPRLSAFYGIVIYMYRPDHPPPHFHAQYGEYVAQIDLTTLEVLNGSLSARALPLVREWAELYRDELAMNWDLAQALEPTGRDRPTSLTSTRCSKSPESSHLTATG